MLTPAEARGLFHPLKILWQNRSAFYSVGLDRFCPIRVVAALDHGREYEWYESETGVRVLGVDRQTGRRPRPSDEALETIVPELGPQILKAIEEEGGGPWAAVCPLPCRALPEWAAAHGLRSVCHPAGLGAWLGDRSNYLGAFRQLGLPVLDGRWLTLAGARYPELASEMGGRFVVQKTGGSGGAGTYFVRNRQELAAAADAVGGAAVWVAPELDGPSFNVNAIALGTRVVAGWPSLQLSGLAEIRARRGTYCGNDFASAASAGRGALDDIREQTVRVGQWMIRAGFRGLFGLDFQIDASTGRGYIVDLNPRWQGSTVLCTQAEALAGRLPLAVAELAWKLGVLGEGEIVRRESEFFEPVAAVQMLLRSDARHWYEVRGEVAPGVYSDQPPFEYRRSAYRLEALQGPDEVLVTGGAPLRGTHIGARATFLRVYARKPLLLAAGDRLHDWAARFAAHLYTELDPAETGEPGPGAAGGATNCRGA
jgi:hypothetical protein